MESFGKNVAMIWKDRFEMAVFLALFALFGFVGSVFFLLHCIES